jgi:hypothetical protein
MHYTKEEWLREAESQEAEARALDSQALDIQMETNRLSATASSYRDRAAKLRAGAADCRRWAEEDGDAGAVVIEDGEVR